MGDLTNHIRRANKLSSTYGLFTHADYHPIAGQLTQMQQAVVVRQLLVSTETTSVASLWSISESYARHSGRLLSHWFAELIAVGHQASS